MNDGLQAARELLAKERDYKPLLLPEVQEGQPVLYLDKVGYGDYYVPAWAVVKKVYPTGNVLIDPFMAGETIRVGLDRIMDAEWVHDMPRRKANPCSKCGHYNHDGDKYGCNVAVGKRLKECGCKHDMRIVGS